MGSGKEALKKHFSQIFDQWRIIADEVKQVNTGDNPWYSADLYVEANIISIHKLWVSRFDLFEDHFCLSRLTNTFTELDAKISYSDPEYASKMLRYIANCSDYAAMLCRNVGATKLHI